MIKTHIPQGTREYLPGECAAKRTMEARARQCLRSWGYDEVETPCMEYMQVFTGEVGGFEQEKLFKFTDSQGRLLVLRPDVTMPLARLAATRLADVPTPRLFYIGQAFRMGGSQELAGQSEYTQIGAELMGQAGPQADAEIIALAIRTLQALGLREFHIELGQVEFFKGLAEEAGLTDLQAREMQALVDAKNSLAIDMLLRKAGVPRELHNRMMRLPLLYGGCEVLEQARRYSGNARCLRAVENLHAIFTLLRAYGVEDYVGIDLGMVQSLDYYSGLIMRGMTRQIGYPVLTGGRYDTLVEQYGRTLPSTGFAFSAGTLLEVLQRAGAAAIPGLYAVAQVPAGEEGRALAAIQALRDTGLCVEGYHGAQAGLADYARARGAQCALGFVDGQLCQIWRCDCE